MLHPYVFAKIVRLKALLDSNRKEARNSSLRCIDCNADVVINRL